MASNIWLLGLALVASGAHGFSSKYSNCQKIDPAPSSPLTGCPNGTVYVSRTDPRASFEGVQQAVEAIGNGQDPAYILVGQGKYFGTVNVTRHGPLTILGELTNVTTNTVEIWNNIHVHSDQDDAVTPVLVVAPSFKASLIGSGPTGAPLQPLFGSVDFKAYNLNISNLAANYSIGQALATDISYANASFYGCNFKGWQDTWYTGRNASTYVVGGAVYGQTDYLFGFGTAWFEKVKLANRACGGGITAWKGTNQTDAPGNHYGVYVANSHIIRSPDANATTVTDGRCSLGRPWNDLATTVYLNTSMDASIMAQGFTPWGGTRSTIVNTTFYAEYNSSGAGFNPSKRVAAEHILTAAEASEITVEKIFGGKPAWVDWSYQV